MRIRVAMMLSAARLSLRFTSLEATRERMRSIARWLNARATPETAEPIIRSAARRLPYTSTCLHEAIVGEALLKNSGLACELRIGARREGGAHHFHAWLEHEGEPVVGSSELNQSVLLSS